ncbi:MAG TPA: putative metalloprotease CJM1_0395 family protein, partial [Pseudothauera hydrothermalis]|nr:putative metalloprotease CJM1_0395 family protein [Pseudothauera hydrothermalis]
MIAPVTFANRYDHFPSGARVGADARGVRANAANAESGPATGGLSPQAHQKVAELQRRDREVRAHELAHVAAGAGLIARGANFTYVTGPDGQRYAVAGDVRIDTSPGRTPEETLRRAEQVRAAALAPADPSPQDYAVAAEAARMAAE